MERYYAVSIVTLLTGIMAFGMSAIVSRVRKETGVHAPAMSGDPRLERALRAHANTLEWMPIFLPALWLFAIYGSAVWAAGLGLVWIIGRIVYFAGYLSSAKKRAAGFFIQTTAGFVLLLGALGRIIYLMMSGGS